MRICLYSLCLSLVAASRGDDEPITEAGIDSPTEVDSLAPVDVDSASDASPDSVPAANPETPATVEESLATRHQSIRPSTTLANVFFCVNMIAPWLSEEELLGIPIGILLGDESVKDSPQVKDLKKRARDAYAALEAATGKSGAALARLLLGERKVNRITSILRRKRWYYSRIVGTSDLTLEADKQLLVQVLETLKTLAQDKSRPFVALMPDAIRFRSVQDYQGNFFTPVPGVSSLPSTRQRIAELHRPHGTLYDSFTQLTGDMAMCTQRPLRLAQLPDKQPLAHSLIDFASATEGVAAPGCYLIPPLRFQFTVKREDKVDKLFIVRASSPYRLEIILDGRVSGLAFSEKRRMVIFKIDSVGGKSRNFQVTADIPNVRLPVEPVFKVIEEVNKSDERFGFTGTHAARSDEDLEMENRIPKPTRLQPLPIVDADLPDQLRIKTGSGLLRRPTLIQRGLCEVVVLPPGALDGSEEECWKALLAAPRSAAKPGEPAKLQSTQLSLIDETDDIVRRGVIDLLSGLPLPMAADGFNEKQSKLRQIAVDCRSFFHKHRGWKILRDEVFGGEPFSIEDVVRLYADAFRHVQSQQTAQVSEDDDDLYS